MSEAFLQERLDKRLEKGILRSLKTYANLVDLTSNDYLGLARKPLPFQEEARGSTGSRLLTGNSLYYEKVEAKVAAYFKSEAALIYSTGYAANLGLISAVCQGDVFFDEEIHASCHDGIKLSSAESYPFRHNDIHHLERRLKRSNAEKKFILVESVYSTNGDRAPLQAISALADFYGAFLIVDEAHAGGVFGAGLAANIKTFARVIAFGKAFGTHGGAVIGSTLLKEYLLNFSRSFIYSTAPSNHFYRSIESSLDLIEEARPKLLELMGCYGFESPIKAIFVKDPIKASNTLLEEGFFVRALLQPTVRRPCLRLCLHAFNTKEDIASFWEILCKKDMLLQA